MNSHVSVVQEVFHLCVYMMCTVLCVLLLVAQILIILQYPGILPQWKCDQI